MNPRKTLEMDAGHASLASRPGPVTDLVEEAAGTAVRSLTRRSSARVTGLRRSPFSRLPPGSPRVGPGRPVPLAIPLQTRRVRDLQLLDQVLDDLRRHLPRVRMNRPGYRRLVNWTANPGRWCARRSTCIASRSVSSRKNCRSTFVRDGAARNARHRAAYPDTRPSSRSGDQGSCDLVTDVCRVRSSCPGAG
jgi:hypothetical protein